MLVLGLTGGSGAGKGEAANIFAGRGIYSIDTDKVSRKVCEAGSACLAELCESFGEGILNGDRSLNRKKLAELVFLEEDSGSREQKLSQLNSITHKHILRECRLWLEQRKAAGDYAAIIDAPLLFESGFNNYCDHVIAVISDRSLRLERIMKRDGITHELALKRIEAQHTDRFFISHCDYIIYNNRDINSISLQIDVILQQIHFRG